MQMISANAVTLYLVARSQHYVKAFAFYSTRINVQKHCLLFNIIQFNDCCHFCPQLFVKHTKHTGAKKCVIKTNIVNLQKCKIYYECLNFLSLYFKHSGLSLNSSC